VKFMARRHGTAFNAWLFRGVLRALRGMPAGSQRRGAPGTREYGRQQVWCGSRSRARVMLLARYGMSFRVWRKRQARKIGGRQVGMRRATASARQAAA